MGTMSFKLHDPGASSSVHSGFLVDLGTTILAEGGAPNRNWIQAIPLGVYQHPIYGRIEVTPERVQRFAANVKNGVRGQDLNIDYDHGGDPAQGRRAAGWIADAEARADGLWLLVEWTEAAAEGIRKREWKYFSPEFVEEWEHPKSGEKFKDVLFGGGLTNRPFLKDILPINLSEMFAEHHTQEGEQVDRTKICKLLGLSEDASDEDIQTKLTELLQNQTQLTEVLGLSEGADLIEAVKALKEPEPPKKEDKGSLKDMVLKLGEDNPFVQKLAEGIERLEGDNKSLTDKVVELTEESRKSQIQKKLSEIDSEGKKLTPAQRDDFEKVLLTSPTSAHESIYKLAEDVAKSSGVSLEEKGGTRPPGTSTDEDSATKRFNDRIATLIKDSDKKLAFADAVEMVSQEDPQLFAEYRQESFAREEV
jgi:phage I-like protein